MLTGTQCAAARALLQWKQADLSDAIKQAGGKLSVTAITAFERGGAIRASNASTVRETFEANGIQFLDNGDVATGPGVALRSDKDSG